MAERRYGFQCSFSEGFLLLLSLLLTSSFVFLFGMYVGKAGNAGKETQQTEIVRLPVTALKESPSFRPQTAAPLPARKPVEKPSLQSPTNVPVFADMEEEKFSLPPPPPKVTAKVEPMPLPPPKKEASVQPTARSPLEDSSAAAERPARRPSQREDAPSVERPARKPPPPPAPPKVKAAEVKPAAPPKVVASVKPTPVPRKPLSSATTAPPKREKPVASSAGRWSIQVQETRQQETVQQTIRLLRAQGYVPTVIKAMKSGEVWYRVRVGKFRRQEEAVTAIADIRRGGRFNQAYMVLE